MNKLLVILLIIVALPSKAQKIAFSYSDSVIVINETDTLYNAWLGGLQSPQFSKIDLNNDGNKDLFVFERYDNSVHVFLAVGNKYILNRTIPSYFPVLNSWALLADYNCDGKEDIFTSSGSGIKVYKNTSSANTISFQLAYNQLNPTNGPLNVPAMDIPAITDIDNDGDIDFLAFDFAGSYVLMFKNLRVDDGLPCDSIKLTRVQSCWGSFQEGSFDNSISLGISCKTNETEKTLHIGSTLMAFDNDNDGDKDILIGDITGTNLTYLENGGDNINATMVSQNTSFPTSKNIDIYAFPAAYHVDIDNDNKRDLVISTNDPSEAGARNYEQTWYYKNIGADLAPIFDFEQLDFLADKTIEVGAGAAPAFLDTDLDGDLDLIIGNYSYRRSPSDVKCSLTHFKNVGSNQNPEFRLDTTDYASIAANAHLSIIPTFGDLDNDGDMDMLLGELNGNLIYYQNTATANNLPVFQLSSSTYLGIDFGNNSAPHLVDIDKDGDLDLLVGERAGNINFYRNTGNATTPNFTFVTDSLGKINTKNGFSAGYSAPFVVDIDNNDSLDLIVGSVDGTVYIYPNFDINSTTAFVKAPNSLFFNNQFQAFKISKRVIPAFYYTSSTIFPNMYLGLYKGGIQHFKNRTNETNLSLAKAENKALMIISPNPFTTYFDIDMLENGDITITDILGNPIFTKNLTTGNNTIELSANNGIYFYKIISANNTYSGKLIKQ